MCAKKCRPLGRRKILGGKKVYIEKNVKTTLIQTETISCSHYSVEYPK